MQNSPSIAADKAQRNYGIDLLRIVSMIMIVFLHVLGHGGILKNTFPLSYRYEVAWFFETASYCAVNCYALISGYVAIKSKFKYSNIVYIWLQVAFYTVLISAIMAIMLPDVGKAEVISAFFPVSNNVYWYFTAYFCISFFTPIVNKAFEILTNNQLKAIAVAIVLLFSILPLIAEKDIFFVNKGYSPLWLMLLYIFGGIISKCNPFSKIKSWVLILLYFVMVFITWGERLICDYHNANHAATEVIKPVLTSYISPTIFLSAVFLCVGFSKLKIGETFTKIIKFAAPATFGVYLIHDNPYVRETVIKKVFADFPTFSAPLLVVALVGMVMAIYLVCTVLEVIREWIFKSLRIKNLLKKLEAKFLKNIW